MNAKSPVNVANPLLAAWQGPFGLPDFAAVKPEHFAPAFESALAAHRSEIGTIAGSRDEPSFDNTITALEKSGEALTRIASLFFVVAGADTSEALQAVERDIAPLLSRHDSEIFLNEALFGRVDALWRQRDSLTLSDEQRRVLERYHVRFRRAGAGLDEAKKQRLAAIGEKLASLGTQFGQNVLADESGYSLVLEEKDGDLAGLPDFVIAAAKASAEERGHPGKHVITLLRSSIEPFLTFSSRRDLREKAHAAWQKRGENGGKTDNRAILAEMVALRAERAGLMGYSTFADFRLDDAMAKTPKAVSRLLTEVWGRAKQRAGKERAELQAAIAAEGGNFTLAASDWRYYAEKVRKAHFDLDEEAIKPYFQLDRMIEMAFEAARRLFGLIFESADIPLYHPDARAWRVLKDGREIALFIGDYFARPSKHSGAWMTSLRDQEKLSGDITPVIVNVMNFSKPAAGEPALLSFEDAVTLFHEFGHGLHGMLSNVTYPLLAGTNVATDFVELPSQLYEHWLTVPELLKDYARHYKTGEPMPKALIDKVLATKTFNQGCATMEYVSSALVDLDLHSVAKPDGLDATRFERESLARLDMPDDISMRHRLPHFQHLFAGDGYAAAYYSYMWSEVLDADAFDAFTETGNAFDPATAKKLHDFIYSAGNRRDPAEAYQAFRGRLPTVDALLKKRGLADAA
jgi:peptidyl-dipeptidase Dcp